MIIFGETAKSSAHWNIPEVVIHRSKNDEHNKFKFQRWQLISSLQCPRRNSNKIISVIEQNRINPVKHTQLVHEDTKRWFPVNETNCTRQQQKCFIIKAKLSSSSELQNMKYFHSTQHWHIILWEHSKLCKFHTSKHTVRLHQNICQPRS